MLRVRDSWMSKETICIPKNMTSGTLFREKTTGDDCRITHYQFLALTQLAPKSHDILG